VLQRREGRISTLALFVETSNKKKKKKGEGKSPPPCDTRGRGGEEQSFPPYSPPPPKKKKKKKKKKKTPPPQPKKKSERLRRPIAEKKRIGFRGTGEVSLIFFSWRRRKGTGAHVLKEEGEGRLDVFALPRRQRGEKGGERDCRSSPISSREGEEGGSTAFISAPAW